MRVHIATDHAGFELKEFLVPQLQSAGYEVVDHGSDVYDSLDDYPTTCIPCAEAVAADPGSLGIVLGGSGNGEQISANKVAGIRSILAWNKETAQLGREHNNANVISIGARMHQPEEALEFVLAFLETPFSGDPRHQRRIDLISAYEEQR
ncbi:ribose-5-phosphate isomerase [Changpingibacter yushuensis]|uniref:ribose-5-phosphate isomerase n=1 Tax=Changpingibacter yushuensis TaxID=2758440 RepID=UPI0015F39B2C|nr:ribose-5-phosphate isomerase [Changpingibacter yushuensis]